MVTLSNATIHYCPSCDRTVVGDTVDAYDGTGDTVLIPADTCVWDTMLTLDSAIVLMGVSRDSVAIKNGEISTNLSDMIIWIEPVTPADSPLIIVTGIEFDANNDGGNLNINNTTSTPYYNFRIHNCRFKNNSAGNEAYMSIRVKGNAFGLIDSNELDNNNYDFKVYGNDDNTWQLFPGEANIGTRNYVYIENNVSTNLNAYALTSGEGARWVYRYNTCNIINATQGLDAHGNTNNDGTVAHEAYENTWYSERTRAHDIRGGVAIFYNNYYYTYGEAIPNIQIREEDGYKLDDTIYPGIDSIQNTYIFNNIAVDQSNTLLRLSEYNDTLPPYYNMIAPNRDYWTDQATISGANPFTAADFTKDVSANLPGTCTDDDCYWMTDTDSLYRCDGDNNWTFIYTPYEYPHPLAGGEVAQVRFMTKPFFSLIDTFNTSVICSSHSQTMNFYLIGKEGGTLDSSIGLSSGSKDTLVYSGGSDSLAVVGVTKGN